MYSQTSRHDLTILDLQMLEHILNSTVFPKSVSEPATPHRAAEFLIDKLHKGSCSEAALLEEPDRQFGSIIRATNPTRISISGDLIVSKFEKMRWEIERNQTSALAKALRIERSRPLRKQRDS
ncbi:hypothetical protein GA0061102_10896 [Rhizobium miluonense]|uniref:Uncharacterized protein n=1 Tax=Rhizobium miluonense TaxID=411945 RepID=A0A1C3XDX6_9HYPH|nr:hypothetical protein GA0061102_10896 [Rhizobium miluonense]